MRSMRHVALFSVLTLVLAACGSDEAIDVEAAWARNSAGMANAGAAYMQLTAADDDTLLSATVDSSVAGEAQIHEIAEVDMGDMSEGDGMDDMSDGDGMGDMSEGDGMDDMSGGGDDMSHMGGAMQMREIESLSLPAGETVALQPGGYHVMLLDLVEPLEVGDTFTVTLRFDKAGDVDVEVEVREEAP